MPIVMNKASKKTKWEKHAEWSAAKRRDDASARYRFKYTQPRVNESGLCTGCLEFPADCECYNVARREHEQRLAELRQMGQVA